MRVLLVEDDRMIGEAIESALQAATYAVDWVRDGNSAQRSIESLKYDAVLLDLGLPQKDGIEVLGALHASAAVKAALSDRIH